MDPPDGDRLHKAVRTVVARHPNLAAYFTDAYGEPVQAIPADPAAPWTYVDCAASESFSQVDRDATIEQICAEERIAVCDLRRPPAFRTLLIREAVDQHRFVLTNHHIVLDGWSLPVLAGEIFASYYGQRLPAPASFRRFVTWLAERDPDPRAVPGRTRCPALTPRRSSDRLAHSAPVRAPRRPSMCPRTSRAPSPDWRERVTPQ